jgi:hypothetical protein
MNSPYVFIACASADRHFGERLARDLHESGIKTWTDTQNITAGDSVSDAISRGLDGADALIYVSSVNAARSHALLEELDSYLARPGGQVIPIDLDGSGMTSMPDALHRIHWLRFDGDYARSFDVLLRALERVRGAAPVAEQPDQAKGYAFISYASEDAEFVLQLKEFLGQRGYAFWDFLQSQRDYQRDFTLELEERIAKAACALCVVSPDWKKSTTALQELHFAEEVRVPVFVLKARPLGPTLALAGRTFIDFTASRSDGFARLADAMAASNR